MILKICSFVNGYGQLRGPSPFPIIYYGPVSSDFAKYILSYLYCVNYKEINTNKTHGFRKRKYKIVP